MLKGLIGGLCLAAALSAQNAPLTLGERAKIYAGATFGPSSLATTGLSAAVNQWRDIPVEWGQGGAGFGRRYGSYLAVNGTSNAVEFAVSALRHEDTRYSPSGEKAFWRRARHIIVSTYIVPNERGGRTFAVSRLLGAYSSGFIANLWYPDTANTPGEALIRGSWALASDMGTSAFREFWPDIKRKLFKKH